MENNSNEMKASLLNWNDSEALQQAIKIIFKGGIIVYPTDTIYGFGVDATNKNSINQLNKLRLESHLNENYINSIDLNERQLTSAKDSFKNSIYKDMYPEGTFGFHHIAMLVEDYSGEKQRLLNQGIEKSCELYADGVWASYFDTRDAIGCYTELHSITDRIVTTFDRWKNAHDDWDDQSEVIVAHTSGS